MVRQGFKQDARRRVTEALSAQRKERLEQERRLADLAVEILAAIAERDEAVQSAEQQAAGRGPRTALRAPQHCRDRRPMRRPGRRQGTHQAVAYLTRPGHDLRGEAVNGWRGTWAAAQVTGVIFSSLVWIVVCGLSFPALAVTAAISVALVIGRNTRPMLWWRFGAAPANDFQRDTVLAAIVPVASVRGRHQPSIWIGRRIIGGQVVMPSSSILIVSPHFVSQVANGHLTDRQSSAIISQALGAVEVVDSTLVNLLDAYCVPWRLVQVIIAMVSQFAARHRTLRVSWSIRWIVFGVAIVDNYLNARWVAFVGVILIAVLSWTTGFFQKRWDRRCQDLNDQRAIFEGLGPDLADLVQRSDRSLAPSERADRLRRSSPGGMIGAGGRTGGAAQPSDVRGDRLGHRSCTGRWNS